MVNMDCVSICSSCLLRALIPGKVNPVLFYVSYLKTLVYVYVYQNQTGLQNCFETVAGFMFMMQCQHKI